MGNNVFVGYNVGLIKLAECRVQPVKSKNNTCNDINDKQIMANDKQVNFEDKNMIDGGTHEQVSGSMTRSKS